MRIITETTVRDHLAHLELWKVDLIDKMEACKKDVVAHQEWLYQYLRVCVLIKNTAKEIK